MIITCLGKNNNKKKKKKKKKKFTLIIIKNLIYICIYIYIKPYKIYFNFMMIKNFMYKKKL